MTPSDVDELRRLVDTASNSARLAGATSRSRHVDINLKAFVEDAGRVVAKAQQMVSSASPEPIES